MKYRDATDRHTDELFEKLSAEDGHGNVGTNAGEQTKGENPDQYAKPEDRPAGNMDAGWGEHPAPVSHGQQPVVNTSSEVYKSFREGREDLLGRILANKAPSDKVEQATVSSLLDSAARGEFETSSPQLSSKSKLSSAEPETLLEQVRRITGCD